MPCRGSPSPRSRASCGRGRAGEGRRTAGRGRPWPRAAATGQRGRHATGSSAAPRAPRRGASPAPEAHIRPPLPSAASGPRGQLIYQRYLESNGISRVSCGSIGSMARMTRETSKARTRERVLGEAQRLFRERGYAATSLEQIAEAADVTKGAIYGHFASKEDLLISAIEDSADAGLGRATERPVPAAAGAAGGVRPRHGQGQGVPGQGRAGGEPRVRRGAAAQPGRAAALQRRPGGGWRDWPRTTPSSRAWDHARRSLGHRPRLALGLQIYQNIAPDILTPAVFERAYELLAGLYPED